MALTDLTRISTSGIATGSTIDAPILRKDVSFRGSQVGVTSALFDSSDNALEFNDNVKLKFGNGGDLNLYHTGSNSYIQDTGSGNLILDTNGFSIKLTYNDSDTMLRAIRNKQVELFYDDGKKFETTQTGAIVTGILTATGFSGPLSNASGISTFYDLRVTNNLTVEGTTSTLDTTLIGVDRVEVGANSNSIVGVAITQSGSADILNLFNANGEQVTVLSSGNVGLGSAVPELDLDVTRVASGDNVVKVENRASALSLIKYPNVNNADVRAGSDYGNFAVYTGGDSGSRKLKVEHGGDVIVENGKLGIGTDNPQTALEIGKGHTDPVIRLNDPADRRMSIRGPSANNLASVGTETTHDLIFFTNGYSNERLRIKSNGQIVLGSDGTNSELTFTQDGTSGTQLNATTTGSGGYNTLSINSATFIHKYGTNERLRINSSGSVSIGNNPTVHSDTIFHVEKSSGETNVKFEGNDTMGARLSLHNNSTSGSAKNQIDFCDAGGQSTSSIQGFNTDQTNNLGELVFATRSAQGSPPQERLRIKSDGTVYTDTQNKRFGIGQDPDATTMGSTSGTWQVPEVDGQTIGSELRLGDINTNSTAVIRLASYGSGDNGTGGGAIMFTNTRNGSASFHSDIAAIKGARESLGKGYLRFFTANQGANTEKLRITSAGDVGISSTAPRAKLDVKDQGTSKDVILRVSADNNTPYGLVVGNDDFNTTSSRGLAMWVGGNKVHHISARTSTTASENTLEIEAYKTTIQTGTSLNQNFVFDSDGDLGVGVATPTAKLHVSAAYNETGAIIGGGAINYNSCFIFKFANGDTVLEGDNGRHVIPGADAVQDLGISTKRWRNVYTTDLQLSNVGGGGNEVDGTEGSWTLQEGESDIYMINRKTGKKYKMMLQEVS